MQPLARRQFLFLGAGGVFGTALTASIGAALGGCSSCGAPPGPRPALADCAAALAYARSIGKPLLVLVIPARREDGWESLWLRQNTFGELLNHGGDELLADLALCELACAGMAELRALLPQAAPSGEALMVLVETSSGSSRCTAIDPELPVVPDPFRLGLPGMEGAAAQALSWEESRALVDQRIRERIACVSLAIRRSLVPDRAALDRRSRDAQRHFSSDERRALLAGPAALDLLPLATIDRGAGIVRRSAENDSAPRAALIQRLARAAEPRLVESPPPGAKWATSDGCGTIVEGQSDEGRSMIACGMGHVPELSRRFLDMYTAQGS
jgi:hypothetical protein